jgi:Na+/melibiose symporter-like transporter
MWTLIFVIILSFIFLVAGFIIVAAISLGNYLLTKKTKAEEPEKSPSSDKS